MKKVLPFEVVLLKLEVVVLLARRLWAEQWRHTTQQLILKKSERKKGLIMLEPRNRKKVGKTVERATKVSG